MHGIQSLYRAAYADIPAAVWRLSLIGLINRAGTMVMPFLTLYLVTQQGMSEITAGWMLLGFGTGAVSGAYGSGKLCARYGARIILCASLISTGVLFLCFPLLKGDLALFMGCFGLGLLGDAFRPAILSAVAEAAQEGRQARSFALYRLAVNLGFGIGPAVGGFLATIDYQLIFVVDGLTCLTAGLCTPYLTRGLSSTKRTTEDQEHQGAPKEPQTARPLKDPLFLGMVSVALFLDLLIFQVFGAYPLHLYEAYNLTERGVGLMFTVNAVILVCFEMVLVHRLEHHNHMRIFAYGILASTLGFALLPLGSTFAAAALFMIIFTVGEMLTLPFISTMIAQRANEKGVPTGPYMGVYGAVVALGQMVGPPVGLLAYHAFGATIFWFSLGPIGLLVFAAGLRLSRWFQPKSITTQGA